MDQETEKQLRESSTAVREASVPPIILNSIKRYVEHRCPVGDFLTAVLKNDLREALGRADMTNRLALFEIVAFLYNDCPYICWGARRGCGRGWRKRI